MSTPQKREDVFKRSSISTEMAKIWSISAREMQEHGFEFITCIDVWMKMSKKKAGIMDDVFSKRSKK